MSAAVITFAWGALGAVIAWVTLEFLGKPVRAFYDMKRDCLELLTIYGNVGAREIHIHDDHLQPIDPLFIVKEKRLQEAEAAFRKCGSRLQAFANTETLAIVALHRLGYQPLDAGRGFIGLSNTLGEYGQARHDNRKMIERSLKATD